MLKSRSWPVVIGIQMTILVCLAVPSGKWATSQKSKPVRQFVCPPYGCESCGQVYNRTGERPD